MTQATEKALDIINEIVNFINHTQIYFDEHNKYLAPLWIKCIDGLVINKDLLFLAKCEIEKRYFIKSVHQYTKNKSNLYMGINLIASNIDNIYEILWQDEFFMHDIDRKNKQEKYNIPPFYKTKFNSIFLEVDDINKLAFAAPKIKELENDTTN